MRRVERRSRGAQGRRVRCGPQRGWKLRTPVPVWTVRAAGRLLVLGWWDCSYQSSLALLLLLVVLLLQPSTRRFWRASRSFFHRRWQNWEDSGRDHRPQLLGKRLEGKIDVFTNGCTTTGSGNCGFLGSRESRVVLLVLVVVVKI